ncbi:3886_t:CDS:2, partial [Paraglomus occultum]
DRTFTEYDIEKNSTLHLAPCLLGSAKKCKKKKTYTTLNKIKHKKSTVFSRDSSDGLAVATLGLKVASIEIHLIALLVPTRIYVKQVMNIVKGATVKGLSHITGSGFYDNIPRILPDEVGVVIDARQWKVSTVFKWLARVGNIQLVPTDAVDNITHQLQGPNWATVFNIGRVITAKATFMHADEYNEILGRICINFNKQRTFQQVLTHKSYKHGSVSTNERLTFVGKKTLRLYGAEYLLNKIPSNELLETVKELKMMMRRNLLEHSD